MKSRWVELWDVDEGVVVDVVAKMFEDGLVVKVCKRTNPEQCVTFRIGGEDVYGLTTMLEDIVRGR